MITAYQTRLFAQTLGEPGSVADAEKLGGVLPGTHDVTRADDGTIRVKHNEPKAGDEEFSSHLTSSGENE